VWRSDIAIIEFLSASLSRFRYFSISLSYEWISLLISLRGDGIWSSTRGASSWIDQTFCSSLSGSPYFLYLNILYSFMKRLVSSFLVKVSAWTLFLGYTNSSYLCTIAIKFMHKSLSMYLLGPADAVGALRAVFFLGDFANIAFLFLSARSFSSLSICSTACELPDVPCFSRLRIPLPPLIGGFLYCFINSVSFLVLWGSLCYSFFVLCIELCLGRLAALVPTLGICGICWFWSRCCKISALGRGSAGLLAWLPITFLPVLLMTLFFLPRAELSWSWRGWPLLPP